MLTQFTVVLAVLLAITTAAWFWHLRLKNAGVVDIVWGLNLGLGALVAARMGPGWAPRRWTLAGMVLTTGLRLSWHIARRCLGHPEEGRYTQLRENWAPHIELKFLAFFCAQALLAALLSIPFMLACRNAVEGFRPLEIAAMLLFGLGFAGESLADAQLARFKADPAMRGRTLSVGLWRYSRHPNYFFEWLIWLSYWVYACASPWGWTAFFAPSLMLHFLLNVTGVKLTEEQCLRSKGEEYRRYQKKTSMFIPWKPR
jgi:steroid 5-alpha reductase family enzyme